MKRWIWWSIVGVIVAVCFIGFGLTKKVETDKIYQNAFDSGQSYLNDGNYRDAKIAFQDALKKWPNDQKATAHLKQVTLYEQGLAQIDQRAYTKAKATFNKTEQVKDGSPLLNKRAIEKQVELKEVSVQRANFAKAYKKAASLTKNYEYTSSNTQLAVILGYSGIEQTYYEDIFQKAQALKKENDAQLRRLGYTVKSPDDSSESAEQSATKLARQNKISKAQIRQAKQELEQSGLDISDLDDKQIIKLIIQAKSEKKSIQAIAEEYK